MGYLQLKGFYNPSTCSWDKGCVEIATNCGTHCMTYKPASWVSRWRETHGTTWLNRFPARRAAAISLPIPIFRCAAAGWRWRSDASWRAASSRILSSLHFPTSQLHSPLLDTCLHTKPNSDPLLEDCLITTWAIVSWLPFYLIFWWVNIIMKGLSHSFTQPSSEIWTSAGGGNPFVKLM